MNAALTRLARDVAMLRAQLAPPATLSPLDIARLVGFRDLDGWQGDVLTRTGNTLMLCGRQTGKSSTAALKALHQAVDHPGSTTVITAPSLRQSQLLYSKVRSFHAALGPTDPRTGRKCRASLHPHPSEQPTGEFRPDRPDANQTARSSSRDARPLWMARRTGMTFLWSPPPAAPSSCSAPRHGRRGHFF